MRKSRKIAETNIKPIIEAYAVIINKNLDLQKNVSKNYITYLYVCNTD